MTKKEIKNADDLTRDKCKERDNYTCCYCGKSEGLIDWHHVVGRNNYNVRWCLDNSITLCRGHHSMNRNSFHKDPEMVEWWKKTYPKRYKKVWTLKHIEKKHVFDDVIKELEEK